MSTVLESPADTRATSDTREEHQQETAAQRIERGCVPYEKQEGTLPYQRSLSKDLARRAAQAVGAEAEGLTISKKLFPSDIPEVRAVRELLSEIRRVWRLPAPYTLPHPTKAYRFVSLRKRGEWLAKLYELIDQLPEVSHRLKMKLPDIRDLMRERHGWEVFDGSMYDFDPEEVLQVKVIARPGLAADQVSLYAEAASTRELEALRRDEQVRVSERIEVLNQAVAMAEQQAAELIAQTLDGLVERLEGKDDKGGRKTFRDATPHKLFEAIQHVKDLQSTWGIGQEGPLNDAFGQLQEIVRGYTPEALPEVLREGGDHVREQIREQASRVVDFVVDHAVPEPRRKILRKKFRAEAHKNHRSEDA